MFDLTILHLLQHHAINLLEHDSGICHILLNILLPEGSTHFTIDLQGILYYFWYLNAKFISGMPVFLPESTLTHGSCINTAPFHP